MKSFKFKSIYLLSHRERKGRTEIFHPNKNLLIGRNHTGKSSLIKSLFLTLGARPNGKLSQWDENAVSAVRFIVNNRVYLALHQLGNRALFDENEEILIATSQHAEWSTKFAKISGFNLTLINKSNESVQADPACFFLPFYINQDGSWQAEWNTFVGLKRFKSPHAAILEYFTGIKPPEYYEINAEMKLLKSVLEDLRKEQKFLERARDRFSNSLTLNGPKLDSENFELEIKSLTLEVTDLNEKQEKIREKLVREKEILENINLQINLATDALKTYDLDEKYSQSVDREKLICPTCGAEHLDPFLDFFTYSEDARILRELVARLKKDSAKVFEEYNKTRTTLTELESRYRNISKILAVRKGNLQFKDVVESAGSEKAFRAFEDEAQAIAKDITQLLGKIDNLDTRLKKLLNRNRSKEILETFRNTYASSRIKLILPAVETKRLRLTSRPNISGSGGPRSILAYYSALWKTCIKDTGAFAMPIVIDSPNQQAQDDINMPKVLSFIANNLPTEMQLIVGSETDTETMYDKKIELNVQYGLLEEQEFEEASSRLEPLLSIMYDNL